MTVGRGAFRYLTVAAPKRRPPNKEAFFFDPPLHYSPTKSTKDHSTIPLGQLDRPATKVRMAMPYEGAEEYREALKHLALSDKIHILGFTREARYIAYCLAGIPDLPPAQLLSVHSKIIDAWGMGRKFDLEYKRGMNAGLLSSRTIAKPLYVGPPLREYSREDLGHIENLIISTNNDHTVKALASMAENIDHDTTILLINDGLGMMEHINDTVFPDPSRRPTWILGNANFLLDARPNTPFQMKLDREGSLQLTGISRGKYEGPGSYVENWPRIAGMARTQHLIKVLAAAPDLKVKSISYPRFLRHKLPPMVYSAITDALSVILGCQYDRIWRNNNAIKIWHKMLDETINIITSHPSVQKDVQVHDYFLGQHFRKYLTTRLMNHRGASKWIAMIREGRPVPINNFNGYFIKLAEEVGVPYTLHNMARRVVNTRMQNRKDELQIQVPWYHTEYMGDSDFLGVEDIPELVHIVYAHPPGRNEDLARKVEPVQDTLLDD